MADNYSPLPGLTGLPNQNMQGMTHYAQPTAMQQFEQQYPSITQYAHDVLSGSVAMGTSPYSVGGGLQGLADTLNNAQQNPEGLLNYIGFGALGTVENAGGKTAQVSVNAIKRGNILEISKIETPIGDRGKGLAEEKLKQVLADADKHGMTVALTPSSDFGANKSRLIEWYKRHGFVENKGKNKDFSTMESMIRPAKNK